MTDTKRSKQPRRPWRPFRGKAPFQLIWSGLFRTILYAVLGLALASSTFGDRGSGTDTVSRTFDLFDTFLAGLAVLFAVLVVANMARFVVGVSGFVESRIIQGTVLDVVRHERFDRLPRWVRRLIPSRWLGDDPTALGRGAAHRELGCTIVVETDRGQRTFEIRPKLCDRLTVGGRITLSVAGWNNYVRRVGSPDQSSKAGTMLGWLRR